MGLLNDVGIVPEGALGEFKAKFRSNYLSTKIVCNTYEQLGNV